MTDSGDISSPESREQPPDGWPPSRDEPVEVMVCGTYHMANPGHDVVTVEADDVLDGKRQQELDDLVTALADWEPDRVAVEIPQEWQSSVDTVYESYRTGERAYDRDESFPEPFPEEFARNEAVQVGFRLADRLDHDPPLAVDHDSRVPEPTTAEAMGEAMRAVPDSEGASYQVPDPSDLEERTAERLAEQSLREHHRWLNGPSPLRKSHQMMFGNAMEHEDSDAGIGMLTAWYERNLRTVRTLWRRRGGDDERVFLLFGSGHVRVLRHLLDESPMFHPVSPLPYL
jgi:hypothetical protein